MSETRPPPDAPELFPDWQTDARCRAITHTGGPLLIVGGPRTGKTSVMNQRDQFFFVYARLEQVSLSDVPKIGIRPPTTRRPGGSG